MTILKKTPKQVVSAHIDKQCLLLRDHPTVVVGHINHERAVTNDYMGRVLYELLQNAVDRAETTIWISLCKEARSLTVANDGKPFHVESREHEPRSDFAALCSIDTSNKKAGESIGNKGVGFKSVFEFSDSVQIRSKPFINAKPWGIRLDKVFRTKSLDGWLDQTAASSIRSAIDGSEIEDKYKDTAPSFYFPEYIDNPEWGNDHAITEVELEQLSDDSLASLAELLDDLSNQILAFVSDIRPESNLTLLISQTDEETRKIHLYVDEKDWIRIDVDTSSQSEIFRQEKEKLGFDLERDPRLSLIFPNATTTTATNTTIRNNGVIHSYLPTEMELGVPLHIQGDFYLDVSRKNIDFDSNYFNQLLLEMAGDALIQAIECNQHGIAELPYALRLLKPFGSGVLRNHTKSILQRENGKYLATVLSSVVQASNKEDKSVQFYNEIFQIINAYKPERESYQRRDDFKKNNLKPYCDNFSKEDLKIIPLSTSKLKTTDKVTTATLLPKSNASNQVEKLFIKIDKLNFGHTKELPIGLNIPNVTVTTWEFPVLSETFKELGIWHEYEPGAVLRALIRAQEKSQSEEEKSQFLKAAKLIIPPSETMDVTQWRENHPSQRILIPVVDVHTNTRVWKQAKQSFILDDESYLHYFEGYYAVDEDYCQSVLGSGYKSILLSWGVWNVIPLSKSSGVLQIPIQEIPAKTHTLELIARSWRVWSNIGTPDLSEVLNQLESQSWLEVNKGSGQYASLSAVYFGNYRNFVKGYYLINHDSLSSSQLSLLQELGVNSLEEEKNVEKIISTIQQVVNEVAGGHSIKGTVLSVYRTLVIRINQLLVSDTDNNVEPYILRRLPLLYESAKYGRGIAKEDDQVLYMSNAQKKYKNKINSDEYKWWLAKGELNTLANQLTSINILKTKEIISSIEGDQLCENFRKTLQEEYLPDFLALASYGDLPGLVNVDEELVQKRWMVFYVRKVSNAKLVLSRSTDANAFEVAQTLSIEETDLLWESVSGDVKKLELYLYNQADLSSDGFKQKLCTWFADELFRRRELKPYFEKIINDADKTLREYGVNVTAQEDAKDSVHSWLSDKDLDLLTKRLSQLLGSEVTTENWHHLKIYQDSAYNRFDELKEKLDAELYTYLDRVNPEDRNISKLQAFIENDDNKRCIAGLPNDLSDSQVLLERLKRDADRFLFKFEPKSWIVEMADLESNAAFDKLADGLGFEKTQFPDGVSPEPLLEPKPATTKVTLNSGSSGGSSRFGRYQGSVHRTRSDKEHEDTHREKSERGKASELKLVISIIENKISALSIEEREHFFSLLSEEYERLGGLSGGKVIAERNDLLVMPESDKSWLDLLHIGAFIDGPGYDVIDYDANTQKLLLVEVKSSSNTNFPVEIFLSDSERLSALKYNSPSFKSKFPSFQWCLYLIQNNKQFDISKAVVEQLELHHEKYVMIDSNLKAKEWVLSGIMVETSDDQIVKKSNQIDEVI